METGSTVRRNFLWNTFGNVVYMGCQWLFMLLVVRLSPGQAASLHAGYLQTAMAVTNLFLSVASYGMYNFQVSDTQDKYSASVYIRSRVYTCSAAVLLCAGYVALTSALGGAPYSAAQCACIFLFLGYRLVESVTDVYNAVDQKHGRLDLVGKTYLARGVLSLALFCAVLWASGNLALTLALLLAGNLVFFALYTVPRARGFYTPQRAARAVVLALLAECLPLAVYMVLNTAAASVPKLFLERLLGTEAMGIYGSVTAPVLLLQTGAGYLFIPFIGTFAACWQARDKRGFAKALVQTQGIILLLLPLGLLVAKYLGTWGIATFIKAEYTAYAYLLAPMVICAVLTATVMFFSMVLTVMRCVRVLLVANVLGILASVALSVPCLRLWGLQGATYAAIGALCVQVLCLLVGLCAAARRHLQQAPPAGEQ